MEDQKDNGDKFVEAPREKGAESEGVRKQAQEGMKDLSQDTKEYYQARKGGMRDKHTSEIFGAQPQFFDSGKDTGKGNIREASKDADKGNIRQEHPGDNLKQAPVGEKQGDLQSQAGTGEPRLTKEQWDEVGKKIGDFSEKAKQFVKDHPEWLVNPLLPPMGDKPFLTPEKPPEQHYDELKTRSDVKKEEVKTADAHDKSKGADGHDKPESDKAHGDKQPHGQKHAGDAHPGSGKQDGGQPAQHGDQQGHKAQHDGGRDAGRHGDGQARGHEEPGRHLPEFGKHFEALAKQFEQIAKLHPELLAPLGMDRQQIEKLAQQMEQMSQMAQMAQQMGQAGDMLGGLGGMNPLELGQFTKQIQDLTKSLPVPGGMPQA